MLFKKHGLDLHSVLDNDMEIPDNYDTR